MLVTEVIPGAIVEAEIRIIKDLNLMYKVDCVVLVEVLRIFFVIARYDFVKPVDRKVTTLGIQCVQIISD